jgi:ATP-dependent DNA helicase DinG
MPLTDIARIFAASGPLTQAAPGYRSRPQQIEMAQSIARVLDEQGVLICEAGTGTGKTFAYLVPTLLSGGRVIISTGTKTLQDQLFERDLPAVRDALGVPAVLALLKGRANYLCLYHLERAQTQGRLSSRTEAAHLRAITRFAQETTTGDKAALTAVPEDSGAWRLATSTRDNCLGSQCPQIKRCFVARARRAALEADVIVVNHHLFFADLMLRDEGVGELLPSCNTVVFDEAHQLPEIAGLFWGQGIGTPHLVDLARDMLVEALISAKDYSPLHLACKALDKAARDMRLAMGTESRRCSAAQWRELSGAAHALKSLLEALNACGDHLVAMAGRSEGMDNGVRRVTELRLALTQWQNAVGAQQDGLQDAAVADQEPPAVPMVYWVDVTHYHVLFHKTPLSVDHLFARMIREHPRAWIFTSATLSVGGHFKHVQQQLGLDEASTGWWGSPFDYARNALLYCPRPMPQPAQANYQEAVAQALWPVLRASGGRAFVLCTTLSAMRVIHEFVQEKIAQEGLDWPLLLQGQSAKSALLDQFRQAGNAVLVGSQSFWEGVDVRGHALSVVVIDKLPFAPPDDPVLAARIEHLKRQGKNPFAEHQLPRAVIQMKQGAGRLIRDEHDRGVLMVCDPRLVDSAYGKIIWRSLPPMRRTRDLACVEAFFAQDGQAHQAAQDNHGC